MNSGKVFAAEINNVPILKFVGDVRVLMSSTLDYYFSNLYRHETLDAVLVDLSDVKGIDSTTLGLLAKMSIQVKRRFSIKPTIISTNPNITKLLVSMNFRMISLIVDEPLEDTSQLGELQPVEDSEEGVRQRVIEAHQTLMELSEENRLKFQNLVNALKSEVR